MLLAKQGGVVYVSPNSPLTLSLTAAVEKCDIKLANAQTIPYFIHQHLGKYLYQFNQDEVLDAMRGFSLRNIKLSNEEAKALQTFFII